ncbi:MAG: ABC transporter substrate-binding protein [Termitinemataceae bacterium]|nr:MAG: ABC transporter substrate-binding protein [Termitinemataceae bacterium]
MRRLLELFMAIVLLCAITACAKKGALAGDVQTVKIAYLPITHALPVFELEEMLQTENGNIKVELIKYGSWPELLDALNTSRIEGASVLIELAMKAKENGMPLKAVTLGHKDGNVIVVANDISSPQDLKGKTFAIPHRQSSHNILMQDMLDRAGINIADLNIVELPPPEMPSALANGQIAGYCVAEPFGARSVAIGTGKVLFESNELWPDSLCCGLVLTDTFISGKNETAKFIIKKYNEAGNLLEASEASRIAKKYLDIDDQVLDLSLQWISYNDLELSEAAYNVLSERVKKYGLSDNPPSFTEFVYTEFVHKDN